MLTPPSATDGHSASLAETSILSAADPFQLPGMTPVAATQMDPRPSVSAEAQNLAQPIAMGFEHQAAAPIQDTSASATVSNPGSETWFLEEDFDVSALDYSITSTISEWAQIPNVFCPPNPTSLGEQEIFTPVQSSDLNIEPTNFAEDTVRRQWFTHMSPSVNNRPNREFAAAESGWSGQSNTKATESYRVGLSQKLRPRMEDEALPSSEQLNLFAKLYFHRFHPLLPVIHTPSFRPTAENSLLFLSICSIGSLFVGSSRAITQGSRIFERLNKAILAAWESFLSQSRPDALSMVQAAILGQTYAILSGKPKYLVLADVLHGTVAAWAREANRLGSHTSRVSQSVLDENNIEGYWNRWVDGEQRSRVQIALNIHDAELATLLHHQPIRSHRFRQYPRLASDALFAAPTASKWAVIFRQSLQTQTESSLHHPHVSGSLDPFQYAGTDSRFASYAVLESINARLIDAKQSHEFDHIICQDTSNLLIKWWQTYYTPEQDPFCLPVLWHSIYISLYADLDLLEQAIGRDGRAPALEALAPAREWARSLNASRCLLHASLIARYVERMSISAEPAVHVPRALFSAALIHLCVARYAPKHGVVAETFASPEIALLKEDASQAVYFAEMHSQSTGGSVMPDPDHLYRLIDLLQRGGRWGISQAFASVLSTALEGQRGVSTHG